MHLFIRSESLRSQRPLRFAFEIAGRCWKRRGTEDAEKVHGSRENARLTFRIDGT